MAELTDKYLEKLAATCWRNAKRMVAPRYDEAVARAAVEALIESTGKNRQHIRARHVLEDFLQTGRRLVRQADSPKARLTVRLQWTEWMMARHLFDLSDYNPSKRCAGLCQRPGGCPSVDDPEHPECLESLTFPFRHDDGRTNIKKAAEAIVTGLTLASRDATDDVSYAIDDQGQFYVPDDQDLPCATDDEGQSYVPDVNAVRMAIQRLEQQQTGRPEP